MSVIKKETDTGKIMSQIASLLVIHLNFNRNINLKLTLQLTKVIHDILSITFLKLIFPNSGCPNSNLFIDAYPSRKHPDTINKRKQVKLTTHTYSVTQRKSTMKLKSFLITEINIQIQQTKL